MRLKILPESPTAAEDLNLLVRGADGRERIVWRRNGSEIAGIEERRLPKAQFARGDRVTAALYLDGTEFSDEVTIGNAPPRVLALSLGGAAVAAGTDLVLRPEVEDIDGDEVELTFRWFINDVAVDQIEDERLPGELLHKNDRIGLEILPTDGQLEGPLFRMVPLVVPNAPPTISSQPPPQLQGGKFLYLVQATDPDADPLRFSLDQGPPGMTMDAAIGLLEWAVPAEGAGNYEVVVRVEDSEGAYAVQQFSLNIGPAE